MGKSFFEFLEEEFQVLTSQLQMSLATLAPPTSQASCSVAGGIVGTQINRCQAILQQMKVQARNENDEEFKERLGLYQIQFNFLRDHYNYNNTTEGKKEDRQETTYNTWIEQPRGRHLLLENSRTSTESKK